MPPVYVPIAISAGFLAGNFVLLIVVLIFNRIQNREPKLPPLKPVVRVDRTTGLNSSEILGREFEYARTTASEAMRDRHTMSNFYLIIAGIVAAGVAALLSQESNAPAFTGTVLLWTLCTAGWFYFLKIIRLRQAWRESVVAMNWVKEFYVFYSKEFPNGQLDNAFAFKTGTIPNPGKPWTVFFYSAALIGFLNSVALGTGSVLLYNLEPINIWIGLTFALFGLFYFAFHIIIYFEFLEPGRSGAEEEKSSNAAA